MRSYEDFQDALGRISSQTENVSGVAHTYGYTYDNAQQLSQVTRDGAVVSAYNYDINGNRTSATVGGVSSSATYDAQDRLMTYGTFSYVYNPQGQLVSKSDSSTGQTTSYNYDVLGNLKSVTLPDGKVISYIVDGSNRRIGKQVNGTLVQGFLYLDDLRIAAELDGSGNVVSQFIYGDKVNVPAYMIKGGVTYQIVSDHLGSPRLIVNTSDGSIAQQLSYDEFGNILSDSNSGFQPFGSAGGLYDPDTKLVRFGAREYDAVAGRWNSKDPILFSGGDSNLYIYVFNDPINRIDVDGRNARLVMELEHVVAEIDDPDHPGNVVTFELNPSNLRALLGQSVPGDVTMSLRRHWYGVPVPGTEVVQGREQDRETILRGKFLSELYTTGKRKYNIFNINYREQNCSGFANEVLNGSKR